MPADAVVIAGRYRLESEVGRGGMGVVWEAYDELLHRPVAVKEVRFPAGLPVVDREHLAGRTLREARAVAAVDTHAAVRVFDIVEQDGRPWIVMELVRGGTLTDLLRQRTTLTTDEVAHIGLAILEALEAAHAAGVLHRDVKPSNILMGVDGRIALTDFGIATVDGDSDDGTTTAAVVGSPAYIAPERAHGHQPTAASDLWSLGATLWTAVEGQPPYDGPTAYAVMTAVTTTAPPVSAAGSPALASLLQRLMARDPAERPTAAETRAALNEIVSEPESEPTAAAPVQPTARLPFAFDRTTVLGASAPAEESEPAVPVPEPPQQPEPPPQPEPLPEPPQPLPVQPASIGDQDPAPDAAGGWRARRVLVGVAALVLVVAGAVTAIVVNRHGSPGTHPAAARHHHARPSQSSPTSVNGPVPAGWSRYTDPALGWSVGTPPGWTRSASSSGTMFRDPAGGRYILIATRYPAGSSAVGAWRDSERSFRSSHSDYQRVELRKVQVSGASDAADWEFTYFDGGAALHALDHGMVFGDRGYAVYVQSHTNQWPASQTLFDQVMRSFHPGSTGA